MVKNCCHLNQTERKVILFWLKIIKHNINKAVLFSLFSLRQIPKSGMFILPPNRWRCFECEVLAIEVPVLNM